MLNPIICSIIWLRFDIFYNMRKTFIILVSFSILIIVAQNLKISNEEEQCKEKGGKMEMGYGLIPFPRCIIHHSDYDKPCKSSS